MTRYRCQRFLHDCLICSRKNSIYVDYTVVIVPYLHLITRYFYSKDEVKVRKVQTYSKAESICVVVMFVLY